MNLRGRVVLVTGASTGIVLPQLKRWDEFDYTVPTTYVWFTAYLIYPLIALQLFWKHRADREQEFGARLPTWARVYLFVQGTLVTFLGLALLLIPSAMVAAWPWEISPLLAQIYSAPFLSYGVGSFLLASLIHRNLFSMAELATWLWFGGFLISTFLLGLLSAHSLRLATVGRHE